MASNLDLSHRTVPAWRPASPRLSSSSAICCISAGEERLFRPGPGCLLQLVDRLHLVQLGFITQLLGQTGELARPRAAVRPSGIPGPVSPQTQAPPRSYQRLFFLYLPLGEIFQIGSDVLDDGGISLLIQIGFATVFRHKPSAKRAINNSRVQLHNAGSRRTASRLNFISGLGGIPYDQC